LTIVRVKIQSTPIRLSALSAIPRVIANPAGVLGFASYGFVSLLNMPTQLCPLGFVKALLGVRAFVA
jgi:hypothetical protein